MAAPSREIESPFEVDWTTWQDQSMGQGQPQEGANTNVWAHLDPKNQGRLAEVLGEQIPELFRLNRVIEQRTGYSSEIGKTMLVDVLSHLGTLAERRDLSAEQEASQLSKIEEHIRRALIEHPEEVVRNRIVDVRQLWAEYHRDAFPYRQENALRGVPRHQELEELRTRIDQRLESARSQKPNETTWEESLDAAADMTEAANLAGELADKLEQCLGVAHRITKERERDEQGRRDTRRRDKQWAIGLAIAIVLAVAGWFVAYQLGKEDKPAGNKTATQPVQPSTTTAPGSPTRPRTGPPKGKTPP